MKVERMGCILAVITLMATPGCAPNIRTESKPTLESVENAGRLHYRAGRYGEAAEAFLEMIALGDMSAATQNDAGHALLCVGEPEKALPHLNIATRRFPTSLLYSNNFATALVALGHDAEAFSVMHSAHGVLEHVHFNMAYLYSMRSRNQEAVEHLKKATELNPDFDRARELLDKVSRLATAKDR